MPNYVYLCEKCGTEFEVLQSFKEKPLTICLCKVAGIICGGAVKRVIQSSPFIFKGQNFI